MPRLYLLRHGLADGQGSDPPLAPEGAARIREEAEGMSRIGLDFDLILASPLRRADETARLVAEVLRREERVRTAECLVNGAQPAAVAEVIGRHLDPEGAGQVLCVGHAPDLGRLAGDLACRGAAIPLGKGALCGLDLPDWTLSGPCSLVLLMPAQVLAELGRLRPR